MLKDKMGKLLINNPRDLSIIEVALNFLKTNLDDVNSEVLEALDEENNPLKNFILLDGHITYPIQEEEIDIIKTAFGFAD